MRRLLLLLLLFSFSLLPTACQDGSREGAASKDTAAKGNVPLPEPGQLEELAAQSDPQGGAPGVPDVNPEDAAMEPVEAGGTGSELAQGGEGPDVPTLDGSSRFPKPEAVRGIYLNAWTAGSPSRRGRLIDLARRTEVNAFVIDIKDATGYLSHASRVPLAREVGATDEIRIRDLPGLLTQLEEAGIYPIARIVVSKDPLLSGGRPDLAIQDSAGGAWVDQKDVMWLNFHNPEVWDYHLDIAIEVAEAGFPEIQWDYVRFPDAPEDVLSRAVFPGSNGRSRADAVREFLGHTRKALSARGVALTADVFGVTTSYRNDVGIGQLWESFIDQVDVALPMVYPSHYFTRSYGYDKPNAYPYEIVRQALRDAVRRSSLVDGAGATRPWLQDFSLGEPIYGSPEVRAQIQATYDAGIQEWILWNPGSRYTEAALMPAGGVPFWLEPVMRVGGEVVAISRRFEILGEEDPTGGEAPVDSTFLDVDLARPHRLPGTNALPVVPIPDTAKASLSVVIPDTTAARSTPRP